MQKIAFVVFLCFCCGVSALGAAWAAEKTAGNVGDLFRAVERGEAGLPKAGAAGAQPGAPGSSPGARPSPALGDPSGYPGTQISPEDMAKAFPAPLRRDAGSIPLGGTDHFAPAAVPLLPLSPPLPMTPASVSPSSSPSPKSSGGPATIPLSPEVATPSVRRASPASPMIAPAALPLSPPQGAAGQGTALQAPAQKEQGEGREGKTVPAPKGVPQEPSVEMMLGQMIVAGFTGTELQGNSPVLAQIKAGKLGGVWLVPALAQSSTALSTPKPGTPPVGRPAGAAAGAQGKGGSVGGNIATPPQVRMLVATLQRAAEESPGRIPLFTVVEQEGGLVQALKPEQGFDGGIAAARLGRGPVEATQVEGRRVGLEMAALGLNFNLAPAGDVNVNPLSEDIGRRFRSFGPDAAKVANHVLAFGQGLAQAGVVPCVRNFPGTGNVARGWMPTAQTSHTEALPDMSASWQGAEITPYAHVLGKDWPGAVQPALVYHRGLDSLHPATLSSAMITQVLRGRLAFSGLVITQDLRALSPWYPLEEAVLLALQAGADVLLISEPQDNAAAGEKASLLSGLSGMSGLSGLSGMSGLSGLAALAESGDASALSEGTDMAALSGERGQSPLAGLPGLPEMSGVSQEKALDMLALLGKGGMGSWGSAPPARGGQVHSGAAVYEVLTRLVRQGRLPVERVRLSWQRIMALKKNFLYTRF